jgi:hypothetical protein
MEIRGRRREEIMQSLFSVDDNTREQVIQWALDTYTIGSSEDVLRDLQEDDSLAIPLFHYHRDDVEFLSEGIVELISILMADYVHMRNELAAVAHRDLLLKDIHSRVPQDYITEAESYDGYAYWNRFKTTQAVLDDVDAYNDVMKAEPR